MDQTAYLQGKKKYRQSTYPYLYGWIPKINVYKSYLVINDIHVANTIAMKGMPVFNRKVYMGLQSTLPNSKPLGLKK